METASSLVHGAIVWLGSLAGLLAWSSVPGTLLGLIPWPLCVAFWGITVAFIVLADLALEWDVRVQMHARRRKPAFRNYSPRSRYPSSGVKPLPLP